MKVYLLILAVVFSSCSLFDGLKKRSFAYENNGKKYNLPLLIPKKYKTVKVTVDSAGNREQIYQYANGSLLYFAYGDTTKELQSIVTAMNITRFYPGNIHYYKGQDSSTALFWRESRYKNLRFGYRNVPFETEAVFDSSINYAGWQRLKQ